MSNAGDESTYPSVNPASIEMALFHLDLVSQRLLMGDSETRKNLEALKKKIRKDVDAAAAYTKLVETGGCDADQLLWYLAMLWESHASPVMKGWFDKPGPKSLSQFVGLTSRQFSALKKKLLDTADEVENINFHFHFGTLLHTPHLGYFWQLPALLRGYVSLLDLAAEKIARGTHVYHNFAKAALIAHVKKCTQRYCDGPVSSLIALVTGQGASYGEETHRNWRNQHSDLVASLQPTISKAALSPTRSGR